MNKLTKFIEVLGAVQGYEGITLEQRMQLEEMKFHFIQLNQLAQPIGGVAIPQTTVAPVPNPTAPGAMQLTSGVPAQVTGCVSAQPKGLQQDAAQAQLNQHLAAVKAEESLTASLEAQVEAQAKVAVPVEAAPGVIAAGVDPLTASLTAQMAEQQPVVVAEADAGAPVKTLQEAVQEAQPKTEEAPVVNPAGQMTLGQFVQQQGGAQPLIPAQPAQAETPAPAAPVAPATLQEQFNAGLSGQAQVEQE